MAKKRFFNTKASTAASRLKEKYKYRKKRRALLKTLQPEIDRISASSKLAEVLATQVSTAAPEPQRFEISEAEISKQLLISKIRNLLPRQEEDKM